MQPCEQQDKIEAIYKAVDRMEKWQEKVVELLENVSNQSARLDHLEEHAERNYTEMNELFNRMREAEMTIAASGPSVRQQFHDTIEVVNKKLDKLNRFFALTTSKPALVAYSVVFSMIAVGTLLDVIYHFDTLKVIYHFFRG